MKINLALDSLPSFKALPGRELGPQHKATIHVCPSMEYVDRAWEDAKAGRPSTNPLVEVTIPTTYDDSIAPPGKHIMCIFAQYAPYTLKDGDWDGMKDQFADRCLDALAEYAPGMKSVDDALELRGRIFGAFELAELGAARGEDVDSLLTFVVVGAGPTGVEMAGQIAELAHRTLKRDFRSINTRKARVVLVDAAGQVLPPFGAQLGAKTKVQLEKLGVEVLLGGMVTDVSDRGIVVQYKDGHSEWVAAATKVWAAGVQASSLTKTLSEQTGAPLDRAGRIRVNPDLTLPGYPEVFVVGDMIDLDHLPGVAQVAIQGGKYAAAEIKRRLAGRPPQKPFHYFDKGDLATISRFRAVARIGRFRMTGFLAWLLWLGVHLVYLTGFKNRFSALGHWAVSFIGRGRSERTGAVLLASRHPQYPRPRSCPRACRRRRAGARQARPRGRW